ncbi:MAG: hypothetical protein ACP5O0_11515 [Acidimicrobiales bacterium]
MSSTEILSSNITDIPRVSVLDADYLINQLKERVRMGAPSSQGIVLLFRNRAFATRRVFQEMYKADALGNANKFEKLAGQIQSEDWSLPPEQIRQIFEDEFLPNIAIVDTADLYKDHEWCVKVANHDKKDAPTGQLAALLAASKFIVYSHDKSLRNADLASSDLEALSVALADALRATSLINGLTTGGTQLYGIADQIVAAAAQRFSVPRWAVTCGLIAVVGAFAVLVAKPQDRRKTIIETLKVGGKYIIEQIEHGQNGELVLREAMISHNGEYEITQGIARALTVPPHGEGILVRDVVEQLRAQGFEGSEVKESNIRLVLREYPCFVEIKRHRWHLGEILRAPDERSLHQ